MLAPGPDTAADAHDYVNASHVACRPGEAPPWRYVAAQGPLPHTVADFWRMAHQLRAPAIVSLTSTVEGGVAKCAPYLPAAGEAVYGSYRVTVAADDGGGSGDRGDRGGTDAARARRGAGGVLLRTVTVAPADAGHGPPHTLTHVHVPDWPDHGVLATGDALRGAAAEMRRAVDAAARGAAGAPPPPPIVHCSAGIGRTGTLIAVDVCVRRLHAAAAGGPRARDAADRALATRRLVRRLRGARPGMVQTVAQYVAVVAAVREEAAELAAAAERAAGDEATPMLPQREGGEGGRRHRKRRARQRESAWGLRVLHTNNVARGAGRDDQPRRQEVDGVPHLARPFFFFRAMPSPK